MALLALALWVIGWGRTGRWRGFARVSGVSFTLGGMAFLFLYDEGHYADEVYLSPPGAYPDSGEAFIRGAATLPGKILFVAFFIWALVWVAHKYLARED